jgi:hypothetical protein
MYGPAVFSTIKKMPLSTIQEIAHVSKPEAWILKNLLTKGDIEAVILSGLLFEDEEMGEVAEILRKRIWTRIIFYSNIY